MARKVVLIDDLDGSDATQTVNFAIGGVHYEIDLTDHHAAEFYAAVAAYVAASRTMPKAPGGTCTRAEPRVVRKWATDRGIDIGVRGRIPIQLVDRYLASVGS